MECIVLVRNPNATGVGVTGVGVYAISEDDSIVVFPDLDAAVAWVEKSELCKAWPYQIVELNEL